MSKITKQRLSQIIQEEIESILGESYGGPYRSRHMDPRFMDPEPSKNRFSVTLPEPGSAADVDMDEKDKKIAELEKRLEQLEARMVQLKLPMDMPPEKD